MSVLSPFLALIAIPSSVEPISLGSFPVTAPSYFHSVRGKVFAFILFFFTSTLLHRKKDFPIKKELRADPLRINTPSLYALIRRP